MECPFCKSDHSDWVETSRGISGWWAWVVCGECHARGPSVLNRDADKAEKEAREAWNDR